MNVRRVMRGRLMGIALFAVLLAGTGLLIAGYGVAVGLGALAGLILAFFVGLFAFISTWQRGGHVTFGGSSSSSFGAMNVDPDAQRMRVHELAEILPIDLGRVRRVVPSLATAVAGGLSVEVIAVELCEAGLALNLDVHVAPGLPQPASMARVSITDDAGTTYRASAQGLGWMPSRLRVVVKAIPAVPSTATTLTLRIEEFLDPFPSMGEAVTGPWVFVLPLSR